MFINAQSQLNFMFFDIRVTGITALTLKYIMLTVTLFQITVRYFDTKLLITAYKNAGANILLKK